MPTSPYYIHPGFEWGPGLRGLAETITTGAEYERKKTEETRKQKIRQEAANLIQAGDTDKISELAIKNPWIVEELDRTIGFRSDLAKQDAINSAKRILIGGEPPSDVLIDHAEKTIDEGGDASEIIQHAEQAKTDPESTKKRAELVLALFDQPAHKQYRATMGEPEKGFILSPGQIRYSARGKVIVKAPGKDVVPVPYTDIAKLNADLQNNKISENDYLKAKEKILNPLAKNKTELTRNALAGDAEAQNVLDAMAESEIELAEAKGIAATGGKIEGLQQYMDLDATAQAVLDGRETIDNVRNTFGVPIQEVVRQKVLKEEPDFNFVQPRAIQKSLNSSLMQQQKNRGMMGSFVENINKQVNELERRSRDIVQRVGVRALDIPIRELKTRFIGSGHERVFEAYMKEVSAEIAKLSQGSAASVAQLPEENRKEWERIHDVNLSMKELLIILNGTKDMANMRLDSVQEEIDSTINKLEDVRAGNIRQFEEVDERSPQGEMTQEEYDTLPIGATYTLDGVEYRKGQ